MAVYLNRDFFVVHCFGITKREREIEKKSNAERISKGLQTNQEKR
jgi:hypothetical protein